MARLGKTLRDLNKHGRRWAKLLESLPSPELAPAAVPSRLREVTGFGSNPGNLRMLIYVPEHLAPSSPLVVVMHGCTQTAAGYDHGAGWSALADRYGFALLFPEQRQANNQRLCFNWFQPGHIERDRGEALSIRHMIAQASRDHDIDPGRVFVTGLSAGGAMTSVMLATYPELFAGGAIVAGLPYGCATNVQEALECMYQGRVRSARQWGDLVRAATPHRGPWPRISVWHGSADTTVKAMNADEILKQWRDVHGLPAHPTAQDMVDGYPRQVWRDAQGRDVIESFTIAGMAHGTPLATGGENGYGAAGPFLLEVGISSTYHIAKFWGLTDTAVSRATQPSAIVSPSGVVEWPTPARAVDGAEPPKAPGAPPPGKPSGGSLVTEIQSAIDKALKAAGLKS